MKSTHTLIRPLMILLPLAMLSACDTLLYESQRGSNLRECNNLMNTEEWKACRQRQQGNTAKYQQAREALLEAPAEKVTTPATPDSTCLKPSDATSPACRQGF